jgi:hypothetical protein
MTHYELFQAYYYLCRFIALMFRRTSQSRWDRPTPCRWKPFAVSLHPSQELSSLGVYYKGDSSSKPTDEDTYGNARFATPSANHRATTSLKWLEI